MRERVLNFSCAMLVSASPVFRIAPAMFMAVLSLAVRTATLMGLSLGASARVDVSEVERLGLGQIAHFELYDDPVRGVLEGSRAANTRVALGVQIEYDVSTLVMSSALLLSALALGAATAAPDQQEEEDGRVRHGAEQEYKYLPHAVGAYHWNRGGRIPTIAYF